MTIVAVDCIKNGRADQFGGPLVSGGSYTLPWSLARSLWLSGYVSVTNPSIFGGGDTDVYLSNLAASLAEIGVPSPIVICGLPFVLFPGDGGSNGLLFYWHGGKFQPIGSHDLRAADHQWLRLFAIQFRRTRQRRRNLLF